jgi:hypothetical protein
MRKFLLNIIAALAISQGLYSVDNQMLTDPFLQFPTSNSVRIVWFTSFEGTSHWVEWGKEKHVSTADSHSLSRIRKEITQPDGTVTTQLVPVWRHEAVVKGLQQGHKQNYKVFSQSEENKILDSKTFTLTSSPTPEQSLKILLTSDHQGKPMVAANLQKAYETIGPFDAVFAAGDLIELPDGHLDWFSDPHGFFPCLQGHANNDIEGNIYKGAEILQHTPIYPAIGNHEVTGRYDLNSSLRAQYNNPYPRDKALLYQPNAQGRELKDLSFNTDTYEEVFSLPKQTTGNGTYYAETVGEIRLVVLYATRIWRAGVSDSVKPGKYAEASGTLDEPLKWGHGDFIFESLKKGSEQYEWLVKELESDEYQKAKLHIVMLHNPLHTLGENATPPYVDPIQTIKRDESEKITSVEYRYPKNQDILIQDIEPLLEKYGVDLVFCGHSHVWNRFQSPQGMHFLETSNVGNSYGAYTSSNQKHRQIVLESHPDDYSAVDDPNGLEPIVPTLAPLKDAQNQPIPYISSNNTTVFSVLDTGRKVIDSYYFDCLHPELGVVKFDSFSPYREKK